ncbi:hypothetical protein H920_04632 [Fukomys damarensis]|uniref:Uncharacterized protein n=1 Tax=Fukomys damarensis TaxID=885580 RepID=A0A091EF25_FUKDA|nr:hypothetical protein H920_04632 [Fukomys damarensis]
MLACIEDVHLEGPKASGGRQKTYAIEMKDLYHQAEGSTLEPGSDVHGEDQSSPDANSSHSQGQGGPNSSSDENSLVCIRKTIRSKLLLGNQQAKVFHSSSLFMAIGNNPQVDPPCPDHVDSVQLGVTS